jgi:hypothetical protein
MHVHIAAGQWALQAVEPGPHSAGWIYSIGLTHNFGHPELVITEDVLVHGGGLLNEIGERVSRGRHVDASTALDLGGYVVEFENVHDSYLACGLCAHWESYNAWIGAQVGPLRVLQVVPPLTEWCDHCDRNRGCLATPGTPGFADPRNRAARRAQSHRRRRRRR